MTEPEVSLYIAMKYIRSGEAIRDVTVSVDGAHIRTKNTVHFDIADFMSRNGYEKVYDGDNRWQGEYRNGNYPHSIIVVSKSGIGDVTIALNSGKTLYVESKKIRHGSGGEYPAMREAIGQVMTGCPDNSGVIPVVAVPYSEKSAELSRKWSDNRRIRSAGICFMLVHDNGNIEFVG